MLDEMYTGQAALSNLIQSYGMILIFSFVNGTNHSVGLFRRLNDLAAFAHRTFRRARKGG